MSLIARYKLDDLSDISGNGYDLVISGTTPATVGGPYGDCKFLDQVVSSSYFYSTLFELDQESFSIAGWVRHEDFDYPRTFFNLKKANQAYVSGVGWEFGAGHSSSGVQVTINDGVNKVNIPLAFDVGQQPTDLIDEWHHIIYIVDRVDGEVRVVIDGILQSNTVDISSVTGSIIDPSENLFIGYTYGWKLAGRVQDIHIYDHVLTPKEVERIYQAPVFHLNFNDEKVIGERILDSSDWGTDALLDTSVPTWSSYGKIGSGSYTFLTDKKIKALCDFSTFNTAGFTMMTWFKPNGTRANQYLMQTKDSVGNSNVAAMIWNYVDDNVELYATAQGTGEGLRPGSQIPLSTEEQTNWNHLVYSYDGVTRKGYLNGVLVCEDTLAWVFNNNDLAEIFIGAASDTLGSCDGQLDDPRIYPFTLTDSQVESLYKTRASFDSSGTISCQGEVVETGVPNPVLRIDGENIGDGIAYDVDFSTGTATFDGSASYIKYIHSSDYAPTLHNKLVWSFRMQSDDYLPIQTLMSKRFPCSNNGSWLIWITSRRIYYGFYTGAGGEGAVGTYMAQLNSSSYIVDGETYDVVVSHEYGTDNVEIFLDGVSMPLIESGTDFRQSIPHEQATIVTIGAQDGRAATCDDVDVYKDKFFKGTIDKVRLTHTTVDDTQVQYLFEGNGVQSTGNIQSYQVDEIGPDDGLIGYWPLDGNFNEYAGQGSMDGVNSGAVLVSGLKGRKACYIVDNTTDHVILGDDENYDVTATDFTFSIWALQTENKGSVADFSMIYHHNVGGTPGEGYYLNIRGAAGAGAIQFAHRTDDAVNPVSLTASDKDYHNEWHHIVVTGNQSTKTVDMWVDGVYKLSDTWSGNLNPRVGDTLKIGTSSDIYSGEFYAQEFRIYNKVLSAQEIGKLYRLHNPNSGLSINNDGSILSTEFIEGI